MVSFVTVAILPRQLTSSRVGKAYAISDIIQASYFYPRGMLTEMSPIRACATTKLPQIPCTDQKFQAVSVLISLDPDGLEGDICETPRPLKEGEEAEWILLSGVSCK